MVGGAPTPLNNMKVSWNGESFPSYTYTISYHITLSYIILSYIILYHIILYHIILDYIISYHMILYYIISVLYHIMLCYIMLYYVITLYIFMETTNVPNHQPVLSGVLERTLQ